MVLVLAIIQLLLLPLLLLLFCLARGVIDSNSAGDISNYNKNNSYSEDHKMLNLHPYMTGKERLLLQAGFRPLRQMTPGQVLRAWQMVVHHGDIW